MKIIDNNIILVVAMLNYTKEHIFRRACKMVVECTGKILKESLTMVKIV
jgi:hypothetical protein